MRCIDVCDGAKDVQGHQVRTHTPRCPADMHASPRASTPTSADGRVLAFHRVLVLTFMEPGDAAKWEAKNKHARLHGLGLTMDKFAAGGKDGGTSNRRQQREAAIAAAAGPTAREEQLQAQVRAHNSPAKLRIASV